MTRRAPKTEVELACAVERCLDDVPLDADEVQSAVRETGIDPERLVGRLQARVQRAQDEARRLAFAEADRARVAATAEIRRVLERPRVRRTAEQAREHLYKLRSRSGGLEAHFHKLEGLGVDDLNQIIEEVEALLEGKKED